MSGVARRQSDCTNASPILRGGAVGEVTTATNRRARRALLIAAFAAIYLIWGSTYLGIKYAIETLPPFLMSGFRFAIAGAALMVWSWWKGVARPTKREWANAAVIGGLLFLGGNGGVVWAEQHIASGLAALLVATEPLWIVVFDWVRPGGRRPTLPVTVGLLGGFLGVWLLLSGMGGAGIGTGSSIVGAGGVLLASLSWATGSLYSALHSGEADVPRSPLLAAGMQMVSGGLMLTLAGTLTGEWTRLDLSQASAASVAAMFYLIVFGSVVAFTAYSWLLKVVPPARAATYAYVNPVVAIVLGWAIAGEPLGWRTAVAATMIVGSVMVMSGFRQKTRDL